MKKIKRLKNRKKTYISMYICMAALLLVGAAISLSVGSADIGIINSVKLALSNIPGMETFIDISDLTKMHQYIILQVRMPRVILAILVGAGLSAAGAVFQGLFRNPLADPHILGVSSGAALGATIAILFGVQVNFFGIGTIGVCAFAGAISTIIIVYMIGGMKKGAKTIGILLTGTAVSTLFSALMSLLMSLNHDQIEKVYLWTMGSFSSAVWIKVGYVGLCELVCLAVCLYFSKDLNLIAMGEETAQSLGIETVCVRKILILTVSVMVAACVSVSGVIGFVGLVIPHIVRFLLGDDYRKIIPGSILGGGAFLMICDTLARTLTAPGELPVGVLTAIVGAPYLIVLIRRKMS